MDIKKSNLIHLLFLIALIIFVVLQFRGLFVPADGDEDIYFYMGRLVAEENMPYSDFFFAHPPLHILAFAFLYKLAGFNLFIFKLVPLLSILVSVFFLFKIIEKKFDGATALIASILFLFSFIILFNSVNAFGVNLALAFLSAGFYFFEIKEKPVVAGILFALSALTRYYVIPILIIFLLYSFFVSRKKTLKCGIALGLLFIIAQVLLILLLGQSYLAATLEYHLHKTEAANKHEILKEVFSLNIPLFALSLLSLFCWKRKGLWPIALMSIGYLAFLLLQPRVFPFYFIPLLFFLAMLASVGIVYFFEMLKDKKWDLAMIIGSFLLLGAYIRWLFSAKIDVIIMVLVTILALLIIYLTKIQKRMIVALILGSMLLLNTTQDVLFLEKVKFDEFIVPNQIGQLLIEKYPNTEVIGDALAPLVALQTGHKIKENLVDLNEQVFMTNILNPDDFAKRISNREFPLIIASQEGILLQQPIRDVITKTCKIAARYKDNVWGEYLVFDCS